MALNFTGNSDRVNFGSGASLDDLDVGTRLAWIYPTNISSSPPPHIIDKRDGSGYKALYFDTNTGSGVLAMAVDRTVDLACKSATGFMTTDTWQFVGAVYDTAGASGDQKVYRGTLSTIAVEPGSYVSQGVGSGAVVSDASGNLSVGNVNGINNFQTDGLIAWVGIWDRVLTIGEIRAQQFRPHVTSGCVLFSHLGFNGTGTQADWSGNGNAGTVTGAAVADHVPLPPPFGLDAQLVYISAGGSTIEATASDIADFSDSVAKIATLVATASEGLGIGDTPDKIATLETLSTDGAVLSDTILSIASLFASAPAEGVVMSDTLAVVASALATSSDSLVVSDSSSATASLLGTALDSMTLSETVGVAALLAATSIEGVVFSEIAAGDLLGDLQAIASDSLVLSDSTLATSNLLAIAIDALTVSDVVAGILALLATSSDSVVVSDSSIGGLLKSAISTDGLVVSDTGAVDATFEVTAQDSAMFSDVVSAIISLSALASDGFVLNDISLYYQAQGIVKITFTAGSGTITFIVKRPEVTMTSKAPSITYS